MYMACDLEAPTLNPEATKMVHVGGAFQSGNHGVVVGIEVRV